MAEWSFERNESPTIPEGPHRVRITKAEKTVSKQNNPMLKLQLQVSGYNQPIFHYITFMENNKELTNKLLTQFFDSFPGIPEGEFDTSKWAGADGAAMIKHDSYNGLPSPKVSWFIHRSRQTNLPDFVDTKVPNQYASQKQSEESSNETKSEHVPEQTSTGDTETEHPSTSDAKTEQSCGVQVILLPNGQLQLPNGEIVRISVQDQPVQPQHTNDQNMASFGPNESWNEKRPSLAEQSAAMPDTEFEQKLDAFMKGIIS